MEGFIWLNGAVAITLNILGACCAYIEQHLNSILCVYVTWLYGCAVNHLK